MIKQTELYCAKCENGYEDFYDQLYLVSLSGVDEDKIFKVLVKETKVNSPTNYYAWWDNEENKFTFVYKTRYLVEMCFPYGSKYEEERGNGMIYPVEITLIK